MSVERAPLGLASTLIDWQRRHGRSHLPWQASREPYRVWLSEIMLQQTQVSTVLPYYERFLARFPDVKTLAEAPLDEVLAHWAGLGYYSRARHLHRCAQKVVGDHGGEFPRSAAALLGLPGIGRSTAAAIAAFCHQERVPILDGNVKRVLTRVLGFEGDLAEARHEQALWAIAAELLPPAEGMVAYTQGLMDLGATLCKSRNPGCGACPWSELCVAREQGQPTRYPVKTRRLRRTQRANALLWLERGNAAWLVRRPDTGVWAGLWSLPEFDSVEAADLWLGAAAAQSEVLPTVRHALTHFDWALTPLRLRLEEPNAASLAVKAAGRWPEGRWVERSEWADFGQPAPVRKLLQGSL
jgi:A/G-specific adenine glycosylase